MHQKITTFLWFDKNAEEAAEFYTSIFRNSRITSTLRPGGQVLTVTFELEGQQYIALNGGPQFRFSEAISLFVSCETQEEVNYYWERLLEGGAESQCGWLKDKFGLSWQIVPTALSRYLSDPDPKKAKAAMDAMLKMRKIIISELQKAHDAA
jgi:predicted 3-demethylubiquinone-9 3-methyltransferase (glyoxalase superfamily)